MWRGPEFAVGIVYSVMTGAADTEAVMANPSKSAPTRNPFRLASISPHFCGQRNIHITSIALFLASGRATSALFFLDPAFGKEKPGYARLH
jgi:hypothetical protein